MQAGRAARAARSPGETGLVTVRLVVSSGNMLLPFGSSQDDTGVQGFYAAPNFFNPAPNAHLRIYTFILGNNGRIIAKSAIKKVY
jgi:hypothetical protein